MICEYIRIVSSCNGYFIIRLWIYSIQAGIEQLCIGENKTELQRLFSLHSTSMHKQKIHFNFKL